jgi:hypothetical protein
VERWARTLDPRFDKCASIWTSGMLAAMTPVGQAQRSQPLSHRHIPRESLNSRSDFFFVHNLSSDTALSIKKPEPKFGLRSTVYIFRCTSKRSTPPARLK